MKPAIVVNCFLCFRIIFKVTLHQIVTAITNLALIVFRQIIRIINIDQFNRATRENSANRSIVNVIIREERPADPAKILRLTITLDHIRRECLADKCLYFGLDWRGSGDDSVNATAETFLN